MSTSPYFAVLVVLLLMPARIWFAKAISFDEGRELTRAKAISFDGGSLLVHTRTYLMAAESLLVLQRFPPEKLLNCQLPTHTHRQKPR